MSWLEEHINEFVMPVVGDVDFPRTPLGYFEPEELTVIKNAWRSVKRSANGRTVLLPGRDVFVFEILARRENYPTLFVPSCSRVTVRTIAKLFTNIHDYYLFDTGFAGSIPRNLGLCKDSFNLLSSSDMRRDFTSAQLFPRLSFSRGLALKIENTPKYWESGRLSATGEVLQPLQTLEQFIEAARLTIEVYTNSSPKFINKHKPMQTRKEVEYYHGYKPVSK